MENTAPIRLISMPYASVSEATLGLPAISGLLKQAGLSLSQHYLNFLFLDYMNLHTYERVAYFKGMRVQVSEWMFAKAAWGFDPAERNPGFFFQCEQELGDLKMGSNLKDWLISMRDEAVPAFLEACLKELALSEATKIVGFSCSFFQLLPSIALARRIKETFPRIHIAFGGVNCHGEAGIELIEKIPWIDSVCAGESEEVIVPLYSGILAGRDPGELPGVYYRNADGNISGAAEQPVSEETYRIYSEPDFSGFFAGIKRLSPPESFYENMRIPFESSRGCWWGEKCQCSFCGLNGISMQYRLKPAACTRRLLTSLHEKWGISYFVAADNNLSLSYERDFFPEMAENPPFKGLRIHSCVKPFASREFIRGMAAAGYVSSQPGIESLSPHMLKLMNKGNTLLQNIRYLKCARQFGIISHWNILVRAPGETKEDYDFMADLSTKLFHLNPPNEGLIPIQCHRYSEYWRNPEKYLFSMAPVAWYRSLYPEDVFDLSRLAYYFDAEWRDVQPDSVRLPLEQNVRQWRFLWRKPGKEPQFYYTDSDGILTLTDSRNGSETAIELDREESSVYSLLDDIISLERLREALPELGARRLAEILSDFEAAGLIYREGQLLLGLALQEGFPEFPLSARSKIFRK